MKKMILAALILVCTLSASAQELTLKDLVSKATSSETIQKVKDFLETPRIVKIMDDLNDDLSFNLQSNKAVVTSKENFSYIKINGERLPKKASVKVEVFGVGVLISKQNGTFTFTGI